MTATWLDLRHPLDPHLDRLLRDLDDQLKMRGLPYLLTGGMAREILLHYGHGCAPGRATTDVDLGVTMASWEAYEALKMGMRESGLFRPDLKETQRVVHRNPETGVGTKVDLVPFGAIAGPDGELSWPPDGSHVMRVLGYAQALFAAIHLRLDDSRWVPLASAAGIAVMKLVAWMDRGEARFGRDAVDFIEILRQNAHVLTDKELYDDYPEAMAQYEFRAEPAAAWILGAQVARMMDGSLRDVVMTALRPDSRTRMINHFMRVQGFQEVDEREAETALLLNAFERGIRS
jgi:predicted nucleotidyltransferase